MDALAFLETPPAKPQRVYVLHGEEDFLKRQVLGTLRTVVFGKEGGDFGLSVQAGDKADFAAIVDELNTLPFLGPRRLVVVENAEPFVTKFRALLEKYVAEPSPHGVLALDVKTFAANTRLYKLVPAAGNIPCKAPPVYKLPDWCVAWSAARYGKKLPAAAARLLVELVGGDMGLLDQELAKLAIYAGKAGQIEAADVDQLVGLSREANTFRIFDALAEGKVGEALAILDRVFDQGEEPLRVLGAFSYQLRRLAQTARLMRQGLNFYSAAEQAGIPAFAREQCERQLRAFGRARAERLYDWLVELDLGLKGGSQLPPRTLMERLLVRLGPRG